MILGSRATFKLTFSRPLVSRFSQRVVLHNIDSLPDQWLSAKLLRPANRYGELAELPTFQEGGCFFHQLSSWAVGFGDSGHHVPTLALINPMPEPYHLWYSSAVDEHLKKKTATQSRSGAAAGMDILQVARRCDYYKAGFFYWLSTVPTDCRIDYGWQIPSHDLHSKFLG